MTYIKELHKWNLPENINWSHIITLAEHDQSDAPWGDEWPDDYTIAAEHLSQWDYGDEAHETCSTSDLDQCQLSSLQGIYWVEGCGVYAIIADVCGGITCYRCEQFDQLDELGLLNKADKDE